MNPQDMKTWHWEYLWYKYPHARTAPDHPSNLALARDTDFDTQEARTFRWGWDAAFHVALTRIQYDLNPDL